jgi:hypothetical protein
MWCVVRLLIADCLTALNAPQGKVFLKVVFQTHLKEEHKGTKPRPPHTPRVRCVLGARRSKWYNGVWYRTA